ncbi:MAG: energy transducer TonB, partial [Bacteroidetes bacterium]|nr:energy transducer TonB [Bacteroidota bacterium]
KEINFTFFVEPENQAKFPGGQQQLKQYLKENLIDKISEAPFRKYQLAVVKFTIDEEGHIEEPRVFQTSEDEKTDELLLETICNMPSWKPAEYANRLKVKQEFVLTVGDMESCVVNLLNIRQNWLAKNG